MSTGAGANAVSGRTFVTGTTQSQVLFLSGVNALPCEPPLEQQHTPPRVHGHNGLQQQPGDTAGSRAPWPAARASRTARRPPTSRRSRTDLHGSSWFISSDQQALYHSQGGERKRSAPTIRPYALCLNCYPGEASDWNVAALLVYSRELSVSEIVAVED